MLGQRINHRPNIILLLSFMIILKPGDRLVFGCQFRHAERLINHLSILAIALIISSQDPSTSPGKPYSRSEPNHFPLYNTIGASQHLNNPYHLLTIVINGTSVQQIRWIYRLSIIQIMSPPFPMDTASQCRSLANFMISSSRIRWLSPINFIDLTLRL